MRILHTSDWHLGISLNNTSLFAEQQHFIEQFIQLTRELSVDAVVISGDVFDSSVGSAQAISLYNTAVTALCRDIAIPVFVIAGNHDGAARLSACSELLKHAGLYVFGKLGALQPVVRSDVAFYCLPYFSIDEIRFMFKCEVSTYEEAMLYVLDHLRLNLDKTKKNIVLSHAFISGAALCQSDRAALLGSASMVSKDVFHGFDYVALGHLHRAQVLCDSVRYSGSPIKYSFDEVGCKKSVLLLDTQNMNVESISLTPKNEMKVLTGTYEYLLGCAQPSEDYMKVEITDRFIGLETIETFRSIYPNLISISGKNFEQEDVTTLSLQEIEQFTPTQILIKFFEETYAHSPTPQQTKLFEWAANQSVEANG